MEFVKANSEHGGADVVLEVAGAESTFKLAWECARPNAVVTVVALYDKAQTLPLPDMYGKNLTFKTGGAGSVIQRELKEFLALRNCNTFFDLHCTEIRFAECIEINLFFK